MSLLTAKIKLCASEKIEKKSSVISDLIYEWSSEYEKGCPKKVPGTDVCVISDRDSSHQIKAKDLFPKVNDNMMELIEMMRVEIEEFETTTGTTRRRRGMPSRSIHHLNVR